MESVLRRLVEWLSPDVMRPVEYKSIMEYHVAMTYLSTDCTTPSASQRTNLHVVCAKLQQMLEELVWDAWCDHMMSDEQRGIELTNDRSSGIKWTWRDGLLVGILR